MVLATTTTPHPQEQLGSIFHQAQDSITPATLPTGLRSRSSITSLRRLTDRHAQPQPILRSRPELGHPKTKLSRELGRPTDERSVQQRRLKQELPIGFGERRSLRCPLPRPPPGNRQRRPVTIRKVRAVHPAISLDINTRGRIGVTARTLRRIFRCSSTARHNTP